MRLATCAVLVCAHMQCVGIAWGKIIYITFFRARTGVPAGSESCTICRLHEPAAHHKSDRMHAAHIGVPPAAGCVPHTLQTPVFADRRRRELRICVLATVRPAQAAQVLQIGGDVATR